MIALRGLSARTFGTLMSFEPALAALAGAVFLGERLTAVQCLAVGAIMAASAGAVAGDQAPDNRADFAP